ncbi:MAG: hypothetical protein SGI72_18630 [Planctomycetota bacterium]|nr:hypothetical protein [Planctomycetota bacterium]
MRFFPVIFWVAACVLSSLQASAQTTFAEIEPNNSKVNATVVACLNNGDSITGITAGTGVVAGDVTPLSADYFRVRTCALPLGVYQHRLTLSTAGPVGHQVTILGLDVVDLPPQTLTAVEVSIQNSSAITAPPRFVQWYGFGRSEELYVRVTGVSSTIAPYQLSLSTFAMAAASLPGTLLAGQITITTEGQAHSTDTEIKIYDAALNPVPGFANDDTPPALPGGGNQFQSTLQRTYAPGTYYMLLSRFNMANNQLTGADDDYQDGDVLDFGDIVLASNTTTGSNVSFAVTDTAGTIAYPAALSAAAYEILWYAFTVGPAFSVQTYCFGDSGGFGCPCANNGLFGRGCQNSVNAFGAQLAGAGTPSLSADTFALQGSGMPAGFVMYFQGTAAASAFFGDGIICVSGAITRLGLEANSLAGASQYPTGPDPLISVKGAPIAGSAYRYQAWYRDATTFCTSATFNLSNGVAVIWAP